MKMLILAALLIASLTPATVEAQGPAPLGLRARQASVVPRAANQVATVQERRASRAGSRVRKGALVGGLIGLGVGVLAVAGAGSDSGDSQVVVVIPIMAGIGAGVGAIVGALTNRR